MTKEDLFNNPVLEESEFYEQLREFSSLSKCSTSGCSKCVFGILTKQRCGDACRTFEMDTAAYSLPRIAGIIIENVKFWRVDSD